jgi:Phage integrase family
VTVTELTHPDLAHQDWRLVRWDGFVFATASGRHRDKDNVRTILSRVVKRANAVRKARGLAPLRPVVPHTLRRTYISLMLEAGAPLHYVMDQVGHEDSKTTLEIYAQVQKRLSRPQVKRAFEALLSGADFAGPSIPAEGREKMSRQAARNTKKGSRRSVKAQRGPQKWSTNAESTPRG